MNRLPCEQDGGQAKGWGEKCFINTISSFYIAFALSLFHISLVAAVQLTTTGFVLQSWATPQNCLMISTVTVERLYVASSKTKFLSCSFSL